MKSKSVVTVKEWLFDKINETCLKYHCSLICEYKDDEKIGRIIDKTKIRVDDVICESEKAWNVILDAETFSGHYKPWKCWIPKSAIIAED